MFVLALGLRVALIGRAPIGFNPDEASFGYDAYSILTTGKDQWGQRFPLVLKSFGDYKSPIYSYISIPSIALFGLSPFSVRLPNAIVGSIAIFAFYFMIREMFEYEKSKSEWFTQNYEKKKKYISLISAFLFAISPWHIAMSRGAFEANLTTLFIPLGIFFVYKYFNLHKNIYMYLSVIFFGLNLFTYHSAKIITVLVGAFILLIHFSEIKKSKTVFFKSAMILMIFVILTAYTFFIGAGSRLADVSIFKLSLASASAERIRAFNNGLPDSAARVFHNKYQTFLKTAAGNYLSYLSPQFLFVRGAGERTYGMNDDRGVFYWFELPFLLSFLLWLAKNNFGKSLLVIMTWLMISPIPASLAIGPGFAANRAVVMLPSVYMFFGIGAYELFFNIAKKYKLISRYFIPVFVGVMVLFFISFIENYFFVTPSKIAKDMLYGNLQIAQFLRGSERQIIVSRKLSEPHIYFAFANKTNPTSYQTNTLNWNFEAKGFTWVDQMGEYSLENITFTNFYYPAWKDKNVILVGRPDEFPENLIPIKKFSDPSGNDLIYVVDTQSTYYAESNKK